MTALISSIVGAANSAWESLTSSGEAANAPQKGFAGMLAAALGPSADAKAAAQTTAADTEGPEDNASAPDRALAESEIDGAQDSAAPRSAAPPAAGTPASDVDRLAAAVRRSTGEMAGQARMQAAPATAATPGNGTAAGAAGETGTAEDGAVEEESAPAVAPARARRSARVNAHHVNRDPQLLDAEFRTRFDRVVERMSTEFGHRVEIVETWRDPARQEMLFQQGRTTPGNVVTWTRNSNHSHGRAADVIIDGSYGNRQAYLRLAQVARAEGLRTLGPSDPGHVELPRNGAARGNLAGASAAAGAADLQAPTETRMVQQAGGIARVAQVARVATPAAVARVATVAQVAVPGRVHRSQPAGAANGSSAASGSGGSTAAAVAAADASALTATSAPRPDVVVPAATSPDPGVPLDLQGAELKDSGELAARQMESTEAMVERPEIAAIRTLREEAETSQRTDRSQPVESARGEAPRGEGVQQRSAPSSGSAPVPVAATAGVDTGGRIARVLDLQNSIASKPMTHMLLRMENPGGTEDLLRVGLRGGSIDASLDLSNLAEANRLGGRVEELSRALERHGLEAESVRIRSTSPTREASEMARALGMLGEAELIRTNAPRSSPESSFGRERQEGEQDQSRSRSDDSRNRSDQEQNERKDQ